MDGKEVAKRTIPHTTPALEAVDEWMDVGYDTRTGDDQRDYQVPFRFTGAINKITFRPGPPEMTEEQMKRVAAMNAKGRDGQDIRIEGLNRACVCVNPTRAGRGSDTIPLSAPATGRMGWNF